MLGCTAVIMVFECETAHVAHLGDSRAYIIQEDHIQRLTTDHSYVQSLIDKGFLAEATTYSFNVNLSSLKIGATMIL